MTQRGIKLVACALFALGGAGCADLGASNPFANHYDSPPTAHRGDSPYSTAGPKRTVIVVGALENPRSSPLKWSDIGARMSEALSRTLLNDQRFDVRINEALASRINEAVRSTRSDPTTRLLEERKRNPDVDFVITGRVTDFLHTAGLSDEVASRSLFGPKNEAIVAIDLNIVDLRTGRVAVADHLYGTASAADEPIEKTYRGIAMGSYLFWNSPLGRAGNEVIEKSERRLLALVPAQVAEVGVSRLISDRELELAGGTDHGIERGQRYFVCVRDDRTGELRPIHDAAMNTDLMAQITRADRQSSVAWVLGQAPGSVFLGKAVLTRQRPATVATVTSATSRP